MSSRTEKLKLRMFILSGRKACQFYKIPQSKFHPDGGAHSFRAVDMRASAVKRGSVLDDGQTESRTADLFGMTFIHTEESFKHTIQTIRRNSDAIVAYPEFGMFSPRTVTVTRPPGRLYLTAFSHRLYTISSSTGRMP